MNDNKNISELEISNCLKRVGIPCNLLGFDYIKYAIKMILDNKQVSPIRIPIVKGIYPEVAEKFNTLSQRVERSIRHAVEVAWERGDIDVLNDMFGYSTDANKGKTTNSEFLYGVAEYLEMHPQTFAETNNKVTE